MRDPEETREANEGLDYEDHWASSDAASHEPESFTEQASAVSCSSIRRTLVAGATCRRDTAALTADSPTSPMCGRSSTEC